MSRINKLSKYQIKNIVKHFCVDVNATQAANLTGLNRNTINRYFNIFRRIIFDNQTNELRLFTGEIELDESYFGPSRLRGCARNMKKRGRGTWKQPVFGIFERNGRIYTEIIPDCQKRTLQPIILGKVSPESIIHSDGWRGYDGLVDVGYDKHFRVKHKDNEFAHGHCHINGIESFWSFTKRRLAKFNDVKKNFNVHLKECEWRWNRPVKELENDLIVKCRTADLV